jgi:hypothetical protein
VEAYIIQLPQIVKDDKTLNWTDRIAYWFFVHHKGDTAKVIEELGLSDRRFREIKGRLAARGHISRIEERGQVKYIAVDTDVAYLYRLEQFRKASKVGFQNIGDQNIFRLKLYHTYAHILHVMEVLEWTYRHGNEAIKNPHHLLTRSCKTGVTPADDFVPGFWEKDLAEIEHKKKTDALQDYKQTKAEEADIMRERRFDDYLKSLSVVDRKRLEERAAKLIEQESGPFFSFISRRTKHVILLERMRKIIEDQQGRPGTA